jgi:hypothetical protein
VANPRFIHHCPAARKLTYFSQLILISLFNFAQDDKSLMADFRF